MLAQKLPDYKSKQIIWLRSDKEVEDFLAQQNKNGDEKNPCVIAGEAYERMRLRPTLLTATLR